MGYAAVKFTIFVTSQSVPAHSSLKSTYLYKNRKHKIYEGINTHLFQDLPSFQSSPPLANQSERKKQKQNIFECGSSMVAMREIK